MEWKKLVTPGYVWVARLNAITWVGLLFMACFAGSLVRDIHGNTAGLAQALAKMDTAPASWWERFKAAPWDTVKGTASAGLTASKPPRPVLDQNVVMSIQPIPMSPPILPEGLTKPADLKSYVDGNVVALNTSGKLATEYPACDPLDDLRKPWVNTATGQPDIPRCLVSKSGNTIWMVSVISDGNQFMPRMMPWFGVFHKDAKGWTYFNVEGFAGSGKLPSYKSITWDMIPYQMGSDFPYLVAKAGEVK